MARFLSTATEPAKKPAAGASPSLRAIEEPAELELQIGQFITQVGQRVFEARQKSRMSRRVLSERSGVSQRTIVLLETGVGNISIALLYRVARALGYEVEQFIATQSPASPATAKAKRVCLIGLRGAGKSTLGNAVSTSLALPFIELNREIESLSGMPVQSLMSLYGQEGYRQLERQAIENIVAEEQSVLLAAAGGVVSDAQTYSFLLEHFHTVWLKASPEEHMQRVIGQGDERPMAGNPEAMNDLKSILTSRETLYAGADAMVDTTNRSVAESHHDLLDTVQGLLID